MVCFWNSDAPFPMVIWSHFGQLATNPYLVIYSAYGDAYVQQFYWKLAFTSSFQQNWAMANNGFINDSSICLMTTVRKVIKLSLVQWWSALWALWLTTVIARADYSCKMRTAYIIFNQSAISLFSECESCWIKCLLHTEAYTGNLWPQRQTMIMQKWHTYSVVRYIQ